MTTRSPECRVSRIFTSQLTTMSSNAILELAVASESRAIFIGSPLIHPPQASDLHSHALSSVSTKEFTDIRCSPEHTNLFLRTAWQDCEQLHKRTLISMRLPRCKSRRLKTIRVNLCDTCSRGANSSDSLPDPRRQPAKRSQTRTSGWWMGDGGCRWVQYYT